VTSISTDLGNTSVYGALCSGGTLVLIDAVTAADPAALSRRLRESPVDVLKITPSHLAALVAGEDAGVLPARWLVLGGERAPWDLVERVRRLSAVAIMNHYGPTETTVGCCAMAVDGPGPWAPRSVPIGRPLANTACYVLDARQRLVDIGLPGRLFVGGAGVARGYVGQDALTAQRFVPNPFSAQGELGQTRMYDTGDLARWLPDGTLEFLGRVDDQIKIRGYRVEPGEVESALRAHPRVRDAVVVAADDGGAPRLVAYAVSAPPASAQDLRLHLQTLLPDQMVPSAIALMAELPRTASGKIDRRALPDPATIAVEPEGPYVAPSTPVEEAIAAVWAEVLAVERVSATDDFFALGGHSLLATHVVAQLRSDFAVDLPLYALFVSPTVQTLADEVQRLLAEDPGDGSPTGGDLAAAGDA
jgi:acyl-coenzyme A synthetase/AMP-(fatty) acid ligase/acyl carrier protein